MDSLNHQQRAEDNFKKANAARQDADALTLAVVGERVGLLRPPLRRRALRVADLRPEDDAVVVIEVALDDVGRVHAAPR